MDALTGRRCRACGRLTFPAQDYGCEACGAGPEHLAPEPIAGTGSVRAAATVRFPPGSPDVPYTVATIDLDAGIVVTALLTVADDRDVARGARVHAVTLSDGQVRFAPDTP